MTDSPRTLPRSPYWGVPVARAIPFIVTALVITFSSNHSAQVGLYAYGVFALISGVLTAVLSWRTLAERSLRVNFLIQGISGIVFGALALAVNGGGLGFLLFCATMNSAICGFLELYAGLRNSTNPAARDWAITGALTVVFALVLIFFPTDPVFAVGMLGAYAAIVGLLLVIAGLSLRWGVQAQASPTRIEKTP
ncbi:hypothetical protein N1028_04560 [Herbiconiux sp. CPCC 203407]|uniref:DUF308 domain-containing protein n=1 Tax=Herbiconiux oxytropis TaxID=2970915 RepID=A0AA41XBI3_9MICO|nr:hypothetical protein [Herbiconiux oxytropis]MCS5723164.1 hypothetical protein [Herbiconiux oxytropis]MCS5725161.1 hypothetical protein [Herbiconiux oxytropis]